jgi:hypothetical protein
MSPDRSHVTDGAPADPGASVEPAIEGMTRVVRAHRKRLNQLDECRPR